MDIATFLLLIAVILLLIVVARLSKRVDQQEKTLIALAGNAAHSLDLMSQLARANKQLAVTLEETMVEVKGHSEMIVDIVEGNTSNQSES